MKCPNCNKEAELYLISVLPPEAHLSSGPSIYWCPRCGTLFTVPYFAIGSKAEIKDVKVPWVSSTKAPGAEEN
jgi:hypothetical protein